MKCENENCQNEATVHLTEIRDGKKHEMHLCEQCAAEKGLPGKASHFSISDLLAGIASQAQTQAKQGGARRSKETACPGCTTTLSQFQASGRFGCQECYTTFRDDVQGLVEKIHDSSQHVGKVPRRVSTDVTLQKDIRQLQLELKRAIRREDYEQAAGLRDQIKQMEDRLAEPAATDVPAKPAPAPAPAPQAPAKPAGGHGKKKEKPDNGEKKG